jgi:predicted O-methyltransferase YrrM
MTIGRLQGDQFRDAVRRLFVPGMGTEIVAPLLATLVLLHRPRRVLEVGMGYTTPFLAMALADLEEEVARERAALTEKTRPYLAAGRTLDDEWAFAPPALAAPHFHVPPFHPRLVAVDDLSHPDSSAREVQVVLEELGLQERVEVVNTDIRNAAAALPDISPIDFAWVDAWECLYFFDHFWGLINPDGGILVMHYLMTYPEGEAIIRYLQGFQRANPGAIEIVNLLEAHKLTQNSVTILRRTDGAQPRTYGARGGRIDYGDRLHERARQILERPSNVASLAP